MAYLTEANFDSRSKRIIKNAKIAKRGRIHTITEDGLIISRPRRVRRELPLMGLMRIALALWAFKALAILNLGVGDYQARVETLASGNSVDQAAAFVLSGDALTLAVVDLVQRGMNILQAMELAAIF